MLTTHNTVAEKTGGHALCMLRGIIFIELRAAVPAEDTYSTAVLMYGEDSSHNYTFRTELQPILRYRTTDYGSIVMHYTARRVLLRAFSQQGWSTHVVLQL